MDNTITVRQRRYKERLYKAGLKQMLVFVKRKEGKITEKISMTEYMRLLKKMTSGLDKNSLTRLLYLQLKIAKGKIEEVNLRKNK